MLSALGLLDESMLLAHAAGASAEDVKLIAASGAKISCTPGCELQQGLGAPAAWVHEEWHGSVSIGVDSHSVVRGGMQEQMRLVLQYARGMRTVGILENGGFPARVAPTVEDVFNMATVDGAKAIGMGGEVGRLKVGYKADVVVWETESPSMVCAGAEDALAAVVGFAGVRDVEYVLVDGVSRKEEGRLVACRRETVMLGQEQHREKSTAAEESEAGATDKPPSDGVGDSLANVVKDRVSKGDRNRDPQPELDPDRFPPGAQLAWSDVARELQRSRKDIEARMQAVGFDAATAREGFMAAFMLDKSVLVE